MCINYDVVGYCVNILDYTEVGSVSLYIYILNGHRGLAGPDCQHIVIDEFLCMVSGCALETDVACVTGCLKQKLTWFKVKQIPLYRLVSTNHTCFITLSCFVMKKVLLCL